MNVNVFVRSVQKVSSLTNKLVNVLNVEKVKNAQMESIGTNSCVDVCLVMIMKVIPVQGIMFGMLGYVYVCLELNDLSLS